MLQLLRRAGRPAFVLGTSRLFDGLELPNYVKFHGVWPRLRIIFQYQRETASNTVSYRRSNKQFTFSLPPKGLNLPPEVTRDDNEGACTRLANLEFLFDFSNLNAVAASQYKRRRVELLTHAAQLLYEYAQLRMIFEQEYDEELDREIGVRIEWENDDQVTLKSRSWPHHVMLLIGINFGETWFTQEDFRDRCNPHLRSLHPDDQIEETFEALMNFGLLEKKSERYRRTHVQYTLQD